MFLFLIFFTLSGVFAQEVITPTIKGGESRVVSLDVEGMDITEVLKIISDTSGWTILCTPQVKGKVTLWIKDITVQELLDKVVITNGLVYTREDNTIMVMSQDEYARQFGQIRKIFNVNYANVQELSELLKGFSSTAGKVLADPRTNKIIVIDTKEKVKVIEKIINQLDEKSVIHTFNLDFADAETVQKKLGEMVTTKGKINADKALNQVLVIDTPANIEIMKKIVERMDKEPRITTEMFALQYARAEELAKSLGKLLSAGGVVQADKTSNQLIITDTYKNIERIRKIIVKVDSQRFQISSFQLNYALAEEIKPKLTKLIKEEEGWVEVDKRSNKVIACTLSSKMEQIKEMIKTFDEKNKQVLIEARIMSVDRNKLKKLGIEWSATGEHDLKVSGNVSQDLTTSAASLLFQMGNLKKDMYNVIIKALESESTTDLLSSPRVLVVNDQKATFKVGSEQPYRTITIVPQTGVEYEEVKFVTVGVTLTVTPHINEDGYITMKVNPKITSLVGTTEKVPVVEMREATSTVMVKDGETAVIGGLIREEKKREIRKVPILGDIPLLGYLFRSKEDTKNKKELIIFITPHIIRWEEKEGTK